MIQFINMGEEFLRQTSITQIIRPTNGISESKKLQQNKENYEPS